MDEWVNRHSEGMLVHMNPPLCIRYISYEICLCTSGRNDLCSWQSLAEPKIVVTLIKNDSMQQSSSREAYMSRSKIIRISVSTTGLLLC